MTNRIGYRGFIDRFQPNGRDEKHSLRCRKICRPAPRKRPASSCIILEGERTSADQAFSIRRAIPRSDNLRLVTPSISASPVSETSVGRYFSRKCRSASVSALKVWVGSSCCVVNVVTFARFFLPLLDQRWIAHDFDLPLKISEAHAPAKTLFIYTAKLRLVTVMIGWSQQRPGRPLPCHAAEIAPDRIIQSDVGGVKIVPEQAKGRVFESVAIRRDGVRFAQTKKRARVLRFTRT